jgi:hypothetical protein
MCEEGHLTAILRRLKEIQGSAGSGDRDKITEVEETVRDAVTSVKTDDSAIEDFIFVNEDYIAVESAIKFARKLLSHPRITPTQIVGIGRALHALERLPKSTPGIYVGFGISFRQGDEDFSEMKYWDVFISEKSFSVRSGGSVYSSDVGSDSYSGFRHEIETSGYRNLNDDIYQWEDEVSDVFSINVSIDVEDDSRIENLEEGEN